LANIWNVLLSEAAYALLLFLPVGALGFSFYLRYRRKRSETIAPFSELRRRPAGESNRLHIEQLDEQIDPWIVVLSTIPILGALALTLRTQTIPIVIFFFLLSAVMCLVAERKLGPLFQERAAYRLGFEGERYVAEELNQLMTNGFHVFHDVPFDKYNMDHVLVGPNGVFVVETKTKRKRVADGQDNYKVLFDGARLNFPRGWDTDALDQARLNAKTLSQWLSSATADRITAYPILTIPGWFVELSVPESDIYVANPKQIRSFVLGSNENPLTPPEIQRIAHQLEEKCKLAVD
jgi:Nuclease-related domain